MQQQKGCRKKFKQYPGCCNNNTNDLLIKRHKSFSTGF